jgi:hypothetical protein
LSSTVKKKQQLIKKQKIYVIGFFRINLPYGFLQNENGEWMAFNREYKPIGFNSDESFNYENFPIFTSFPRLTDVLIREITDNDESSVKKNEKGNIVEFWLYSDSSNPANQREKENSFWKIYWDKLERLAKLPVRKGRRL